MQVELFLSDASHCANVMLYKRLEANREKGSFRHIVIVPDRFTLSAERNILERTAILFYNNSNAQFKIPYGFGYNKTILCKRWRNNADPARKACENY